MVQQQMYPPQPTSQTPVQQSGGMDLLGEGLDNLVCCVLMMVLGFVLSFICIFHLFDVIPMMRKLKRE